MLGMSCGAAETLNVALALIHGRGARCNALDPYTDVKSEKTTAT